MNSMPAASRANFIVFRFANVLPGMPSAVSIRFIVRGLTEDICAKTSMLQPRAALALLICVPVILDIIRNLALKGPHGPKYTKTAF
jgi:hypothetical protein